MSVTHQVPIDPGSRAARTIVAFYAAVERYAPPGSRRRRAVRAATSAVAKGEATARRLTQQRTRRPARSFPTVSAPRVSVVIIDSGSDDDLDRCVAALERFPPRDVFEVIVLGSDGPRVGRSPVRGARSVRLSETPTVAAALRLIACDCASNAAVLLSSNVEVTAGSLDALVRATDTQPEAVLIGPRLTAPDGRVLHAGGLLLASGHHVAVGDGLAPQELAYRRPIDSCSAAAFAVRVSAVAHVSSATSIVSVGPGGDDAGDAPIAMYEPAAVIVMHDQAPADGARDGAEDQPAHGAVASEVRRRVSGSWVLVVDVRVPQPDVDAGSVRLLQMLVSLRAQGHGVLFVPNDRDDGGRYGTALAEHGIEVLFGPVDLHSRLEAIGHLLIAAVVARATVAWPYVLMIRRVLPDLPVYFDTVDVHFLREERADVVAGRPTPSPVSVATRELELALVRACNRTFVVSSTEQRLLTSLVPGADVRVLTLVQPEFPAAPLLAGRRGIVFVGGFDHEPNVDGVRWFLADILPRIRAVDPSCSVTVVGRRPPADLVGLAPSGVEFLGWVADLGSVYAGARVAVAPLRFGAGVKGKVVEAMSHGVPVVTTGLGAEGMPLQDGVTALIAEDAPAFAAGVLRLLRNDAAWSKLSHSARQCAEQNYGTQAFESSLRACLVESTI